MLPVWLRCMHYDKMPGGILVVSVLPPSAHHAIQFSSAKTLRFEFNTDGHDEDVNFACPASLCTAYSPLQNDATYCDDARS
jgi:hypothetical protein